VRGCVGRGVILIVMMPICSQQKDSRLVATPGHTVAKQQSKLEGAQYTESVCTTPISRKEGTHRRRGVARAREIDKHERGATAPQRPSNGTISRGQQATVVSGRDGL